MMGNSEKRLYRALKEVVTKYAPSARHICLFHLRDGAHRRRHRRRCGTRPRSWASGDPVDAPGFVGSKNWATSWGERRCSPRHRHAGARCFGAHRYQHPWRIQFLGRALAGEPLFEKLGIRLHACITGDARYADVASAHRSQVNMMVCSAALINLARKMEERWGIPLFRRLVLRRHRHVGGPARDCPPTGVARRRRRIARSHGSAHRRGGGAGLGAPRPLSRTPAWQARAALHRRRQMVVVVSALDGARRRHRRHLHSQIDRRGQGAHQGVDEGRPSHVRGNSPARNVSHAEGTARPTSCCRAAAAVHRAEGEDAVARYQSGAPSRLRRI